MPKKILSYLLEHPQAREVKILVRDVKIYLDIDGFYPDLRIKVYLTERRNDQEYCYAIDKTVNAPCKVPMYSEGSYESEEDAISVAINHFISQIKFASEQGHVPNSEWLCDNPDF